MGAYYHYVNHTKRQMYCVDAIGGSTKLSGVGRSLGARAFSLMMINRMDNFQQHNARICGYWYGNEVSIEADDCNPAWESMQSYTNITADLILMLIDFNDNHDIDRLGNTAKTDNGLFAQLVHLAITSQSKQIHELLTEKIGTDYLAKSKNLDDRHLREVHSLSLR